MLNIERGMSNVEVNRFCEKVFFDFEIRNSLFIIQHSFFIRFIPTNSFQDRPKHLLLQTIEVLRLGKYDTGCTTPYGFQS